MGTYLVKISVKLCFAKNHGTSAKTLVCTQIIKILRPFHFLQRLSWKFHFYFSISLPIFLRANFGLFWKNASSLAKVTIIQFPDSFFVNISLRKFQKFSWILPQIWQKMDFSYTLRKNKKFSSKLKPEGWPLVFVQREEWADTTGGRTDSVRRAGEPHRRAAGCLQSARRQPTPQQSATGNSLIKGRTACKEA